MVISIDTEVASPTSLALEFALRQHPDRFLTAGGRIALDAAYESLPVKSLVDRGRFLAKHAEEYCNTNINGSTKVSECLDPPPFLLNLAISSEKSHEPRFWWFAGAAVIGGIGLSVITAASIASRIKVD